MTVRVGGVLELLDVLVARALHPILALLLIDLLVEEFGVGAALADIQVARARQFSI